jgi:hypothetical protein
VDGYLRAVIALPDDAFAVTHGQDRTTSIYLNTDAPTPYQVHLLGSHPLIMQVLSHSASPYALLYHNNKLIIGFRNGGPSLISVF